MTQEPAYWLLPKAHKEVEYKEVCNIDFTAPKTMKRKLDNQIDGRTSQPKGSKKVSCFDKFKAPSADELTAFYGKIAKCSSKPALLSIVPPYSKEYAPRFLKEDFPKILTELYDLNAATQNYAELLETCKHVKISVTKEQSQSVERATSGETNDKAWFRFRAGRIPASKLHIVCHSDVALPSQSLIKGICYPESYRFSSKSTDWGCDHEKIARDLYESSMVDLHENFKISDSGLHLSVGHPFIGASPDGLVTCTCCGEGCLEIKCPYCSRINLFLKLLKIESSVLKRLIMSFVSNANILITIKFRHNLMFVGRLIAISMCGPRMTTILKEFIMTMHFGLNVLRSVELSSSCVFSQSWL